MTENEYLNAAVLWMERKSGSGFDLLKERFVKKWEERFIHLAEQFSPGEFPKDRAAVVLYVAAMNGYSGIVMNASSAEIDISKMTTPLSLLAASSGSEKLTEFLVETSLGDCSLQTYRKRMTFALAAAVEHEHLPVVRRYIAAGAKLDMNIEPMFGDVSLPLSLAARKGNVAILEALVNAGADINKKENTAHTDGWTPFLRAVSHGKHDAMEYLEKSGADILARVAPFGTKKKLTALDMTAAKKDEVARRYIAECIARNARNETEYDEIFR